MSFIYNIRNLKDCKDYKKKRREFFDLLHLQQKLNKNAEEAMTARNQMEDMGIVPTKAPTFTIEQEKADILMQQQLARKNLESIMKPEQALTVITKLTDAKLYELNTIFGKLAESLRGRTNITADFFMKVLDRFQLALEINGDGAEPIPLPEYILQKLSGDLLERWVNWSKNVINPTTGRVDTDADLISDTALQVNQPVQQIQQIVEEQITNENAPIDIPGSSRFIEPVDDMVGAMEPVGVETTGVYSFGQTAVPSIRVKDEPRRQVDYGTQTEYRTSEDVLMEEAQKKIIPRTGSIRYNSQQKIVRGARKQPQLYQAQIAQQQQRTRDDLAYMQQQRREVMRNHGDRQYVDIEGAIEDMNPTQSNQQTLDQMQGIVRVDMENIRQQEHARQVRQNQQLGQAAIERRARQVGVPPANRIVARMDQEDIDQQLRRNQRRVQAQREQAMARRRAGAERNGPRGAGVNIPRGSKIARVNGKIIGKIGKGISANYDETDRYREFGKYMIGMASLRKGYLYVVYPSGMKVNTIPRRMMSVDFIKMIEDCLENGVLDKSYFNKLGSEEQDYFRVLAKKCEFDKSVGLGIHRTQDEMKLLERFDLLKGEIVAGNNAPEVMKELKGFVLKFMNDGTLNRQQGNQLLYEIAVLD